jgi:ABC-2 type transport system ATP-binding protein
MVSPADKPIIECLGLTKVFKDFWMRPRVTALDGLDLEVHPHEVFGLLGPNGSGKSTTIKLILGLLFPTRGRVSIFGKLPTETLVKSRVGYMPEESYLYRFLNARETLDFYGRLFKLERRDRQRRIGMLLEMVGLDAVQRRPISEYSKGMQRRIGLAQALINDPDFLILDEPTTGLDPLGTRQVKDLILMLRERGKTVLLCSHLLADVEDVCDRVTVLYGGKVRAMGTVKELLSISDSSVIETDRLDDETVEKVRLVIEASGGKTIRKVDAPRKKLETLFLEIVERAQKEGLVTAGARSGGRMAEFLAEGVQPKAEEQGEDLIRKLVQPEAPAAPKPQPKPQDEEPVGPDRSAIENLVQPKAAPEPEKEVGKSGGQAADMDRSVIDGLLGDEKTRKKDGAS